jgi:hypothetical protein
MPVVREAPEIPEAASKGPKEVIDGEWFYMPQKGAKGAKDGENTDSVAIDRRGGGGGQRPVRKQWTVRQCVSLRCGSHQQRHVEPVGSAIRREDRETPELPESR